MDICNITYKKNKNKNKDNNNNHKTFKTKKSNPPLFSLSKLN